MTTKNPKEETFTSHLAELRTRLIYSLIYITVAFFVCWSFSDQLMHIIRQPIAPFLPETQGLVFTGVMDKFVAHLKISILAAIILSCPFWLYQVWKFVAPGLYEGERKYAALFITTGTFLFCAGAFFVYKVIFPLCFEFLLNFGDPTDKPMITISDYTSFFFMMTLVFGLVFELPLVLMILAAVGLIDANFLKTKRRYAIVLLAVVSAVATPSPDIVSMIAMLIPLIGLYEISIFLVMGIAKKQQT